MPFDIGTLGMQAASGGVGGLLGLAFANENDRRQLRQQGKLQQQQIAGQKEMSQFNLEQQMQLWERTNFKAQMEQLKLAGLSPGLFYGMGGGGGSTTSANTGNVGSGTAAGHSGEAIAVTGMGMQLGMMDAQRKLIEAQTRQIETETAKTAGVDTAKGEAEIQSLTQGIENQKVQAELGRVQTRLAGIEEKVKGATINEAIARIDWEMQKALEELEQINRNNYINKATQEAQIKIVRQTAIGAVLENALTTAQTKLVGEQTQNVEAERRNIKNKIAQWAADNYIQLMGMSEEQRRTVIQEQLKDQKLETQGIEIVTQAVDGIFRRLAERGLPQRNPVGFK